MIIEIEIELTKAKYGERLASTNLSIDTDFLDVETLTNLVSALARTAFTRAQEKLDASLSPPSSDTPVSSAPQDVPA